VTLAATYRRADLARIWPAFGPKVEPHILPVMLLHGCPLVAQSCVRVLLAGVDEVPAALPRLVSTQPPLAYVGSSSAPIIAGVHQREVPPPSLDQAPP
jgi:hypothetical protein